MSDPLGQEREMPEASYPSLPAGPVVVTLNGDPVTDILESADDALVWLINHQEHSASYALNHGGYAVVAASPAACSMADPPTAIGEVPDLMAALRTSFESATTVQQRTSGGSAALAAIDRDLAVLRERAAQPIRLGCSTVSHERLGYCAGCAGHTDELLGWRLLALRSKEESSGAG